jgi:hypothetical protein
VGLPALAKRARPSIAPQASSTREADFPLSQLLQGDRSRCSECGEVKPKEQFPRRLLSLDGRSAHCLLSKEKEIGGGRPDRASGMYRRLKEERKRQWQEHGGHIG